VRWQRLPEPQGRRRENENIGFVIPTPVVAHLPALRARLGMGAKHKGVLVTHVEPAYAQACARGQQVVVLSQVLAAEVNVGYKDVSYLQVMAFNGAPVANLVGLAAAVTARAERLCRFELDSGECVVLDAARAHAATPAVLATHCIPAACLQELAA
jgi:hypothetical protein